MLLSSLADEVEALPRRRGRRSRKAAKDVVLEFEVWLGDDEPLRDLKPCEVR